MEERKPEVPRWSPRAYLWEGGFFALGRARGRVPLHDHHAVQITIALEGTLMMRGAESEWQELEGVVVRADEPHSFDGNGCLGAMLFVDPESAEGRWLHDSFRAPISAIPIERIEQIRPALINAWEVPPSAEEATSLILQASRAICAGMPASRRIDGRIADALAHIRSMEASKISLEEVAQSVHLSPSRFAHLFKDELGLPFRRYLLWRRLTRAMVMVSRGENLSSAAFNAGFSDSAHLTRTFNQMFGIPPTSLMADGELYEIDAPFARESAQV